MSAGCSALRLEARAPTAVDPSTLLHNSAARDELPELKRIPCVTGIVVEAQQSMTLSPISVPYTARAEQGEKALSVSTLLRRTASLEFQAAYQGFVCGRRVVHVATADEAKELWLKEQMELERHAQGQAVADHSLAHRVAGVSVVLSRSASDDLSRAAADAMAALSNWALEAPKAPMATLLRFTVYSHEAARCLPAWSLAQEQSYAFEQLERGFKSGALLLLRWSDPDPRVEGAPLELDGLRDENIASQLQRKVLQLASRHDVTLPVAFYAPAPPAEAGSYLALVRATGAEFESLINVREPFYPGQAMVDTGCASLVALEGVFVRIAPAARGYGAMLDHDAFHGLLMCAEGYEKEARAFVMQHRHGLPAAVPKKLHLHTAAIQVEPLHLGGMVSLYALGGVGGEPIREPATCVWRTKACIVPLETVREQFYVMVCSSASVMPEQRDLASLMEKHVNRCIQHCNSIFARDLVQSECQGLGVANCAYLEGPGYEDAESDREERALMGALGFNVCSKRAYLGEVVAHAMRNGAPGPLLDVLRALHARHDVGPKASLADAFGVCHRVLLGEGSVVKQQQKRRCLQHAEEPQSASKVEEHAIALERFGALLRALGLRRGEGAVTIDATGDSKLNVQTALALARLVDAACSWHLGSTSLDAEGSAAEERVASVVRMFSCGFQATIQALGMCGGVISADKQPFFAVHSAANTHVTLTAIEDDNSLTRCSAGRLVDAAAPVIIGMQLKKRSLRIWPLIGGARARAQA